MARTRTSLKKSAMKVPYQRMIHQAVAALAERNGSTALKIAKYIAARFRVNAITHAANMKMALKRAVRAGRLVAASGKYKLKEVKPQRKSTMVVKRKAVLKKPAVKRSSGRGMKLRRSLRLKKVVARKSVKVLTPMRSSRRIRPLRRAFIQARIAIRKFY
eukprot:gene9998-11020_t